MKKGLGVLLCAIFFGLFLCCGQETSTAGSVSYLYDKAGRLTKAKYDNGKVIEYTYDNAGNLLEEKVSESTSTCEVGSLKLSAAKLKLKKDEEHEITVTATGKDDCTAEGEVVTVQLNVAARKLMSVTPEEQVTDSKGEAVFTISASGKAGNATATFKCGGKTTTLRLKVER